MVKLGKYRRNVHHFNPHQLCHRPISLSTATASPHEPTIYNSAYRILDTVQYQIQDILETHPYDIPVDNSDLLLPSEITISILTLDTLPKSQCLAAYRSSSGVAMSQIKL